VLVAITSALLALPGSLPARVLCLFVTSMAAAAMGLAASAFVTTTDKALALVPILLIPQVVLSDAIVRLSGAAKFVAEGSMISFWAFDCLKATLAEEVLAAEDFAGSLLVPVRGSYAGDLGLLGGFFFVFIALALVGLKLHDRSR